jgi:hypothetical protein
LLNNKHLIAMSIARNIIVVVILSLSAACLYSQTTVQGVVRDSATGQPLPWCHVLLKGSSSGTITNRDGWFNIYAAHKSDSLVFSYLGYKTRTLHLSETVAEKVVLLAPQPAVLTGYSVFADKEYVYDLVLRCRKKLRDQNRSIVSKAYFGLETHAGGDPAELVECYYNAHQKGVYVKTLLLKNGRIGLAIVGNRLFHSLETSKAICRMDLLNTSALYPSNPLQYNKRQLKETFLLTPISADSTMLKIKFKPLTDTHNHFEGELWIHKKTSALLKIHLFIDNAERYPFESVWDDSIRNVSMDIIHHYYTNGEDVLPELIQFNYIMTYATASSQARLIIDTLPDMVRKISTRSILYFYDRNKPFILPRFDYDPEHSDYKKLAMIPYSEVFWDRNNAVLLTDDQRSSLGLFEKEGRLINFSSGNHGKDFLNVFSNENFRYDFPYTFWSAEKRIYLNPQLPQNKTWSQQVRNANVAPCNQFEFSIQILLDINPVGQSLHCRSYTVFDETATYYHLPFQPYTSTFLNIYFDLCEIERRKMDSLLARKDYSIGQIDSLYRKTGIEMNKITQQYLNEVQTGKNKAMIEKWNKYVLDHLGVNNLAIFNPENKYR